MTDRVWLDVPYREKDAAKAEGARWDPTAKRWYAPQQAMEGLQRWAALPDVPTLLPGEDRSFGEGLFVDLVPSSCWFTNVRSCVAERDWERLRRMLLERAGQRCEICGQGEDREAERWLEAHERWVYDESAGTQRLVRLICLCTDCHRTTHFGLARKRGLDGVALRHLCSVTGMSREQARRHVDQAFALWSRRSSRDWTLDLSILTEAGVALKAPPEPAGRGRIAYEELDRARAQETLTVRPVPRPRRPIVVPAGTRTAPVPTTAALASPLEPRRRGFWARLLGR